MDNQNSSNEVFDYDNYVKDKKQKRRKFSFAGKKAAPHTAKTAPVNEREVLPAIPADKTGHKDGLKEMLDGALDESGEEMADFAVEETEPTMPEMAANPQGAKRRLYFILGFILIILAVIGLYSTVVFAVGKVGEFTDNTKQKNEFAKFVYPVVICDPATFDQTVPLRSETMITAAIWDIILYEDKSKYESEFDTIVVPVVDIEQHAAKLFGTGLSFTHRSIVNSDIQFYFDESVNSYRIPSNPRYFTYSPYIENIQHVGERYTLTVGYVSPTPAWLTLTSDETPEPDKYMNYIVSIRGDEMTLISIQQSALNSQISTDRGL